MGEVELRIDGVFVVSLHRDAIDTAVRESTRLPRQFRDGVRATQVHDLVFAVTANELAQENKYKELLRGPDHQERTINSNYNRWNPCVTAEVSVDVTNDGQHWRDLRVPLRHRRDSCPSMMKMGGLWSKFE